MLPKGAYDPKETEERILQAWLDAKVYKPEYDPETGRIMDTEEMKTMAQDTFCIICPPPNAYARPHIGNVSGYAYQDTFARFARMQGKTTLLIPGKDHAAQEAESIFLREVLKPQGKSKANFTREEFYSAAYDHFTGMMDQALKDEQRIGLSADFDRNIFTLDPRIEKTVMDTFMKLYQDNMVYKDVRIVNWSTGMQSVIADIDVEYKEEKGTLTYIKYPVLEKDQNVWRLSFYNPQIVDAIKAGTKTVETRALNPEEPDRYFGNMKNGDIVIVDDKSRKEKIPYLVRDVRVYKDALEYFQKENLGKVFSTGSVPTTYDEMIERYEKLADNYGKKIAQNGIVAIELAPFSVSEYITVATTRPETMLGDTAVVVDPTDKRYKDLIGKYVLLPLMDRKIPVIANGRVDKEFGTGAVKVTPAHSQDDYTMMLEWNYKKDFEHMPENVQIAREFVGGITYINVIDKASKIVGPCGKYVGLSTMEAREQIAKDLGDLGLIEKSEEMMHNVAYCNRTKTIIEPIMSSQWFIEVSHLQKLALEAVNTGEVKIHPKYMTKKLLFWLENLRDWPISRSIWWGYRFPVWYKGEVEEHVDCDGKIVQSIGGVTVGSIKEAMEGELVKVQTENPGKNWIQDPDVFDTWFSSGQWPFATLIAENLLDTFYPTNVMGTAFDILELWVSRMIMLGKYVTGKAPFKDVYLYGLIQAEDGQKMSKSKGNSVSMDDIVLKYGADTLRLFYIVGNKAGANYRVDYEKIEGYRRFLNKIWNASKFVLMNVESVDPNEPVGTPTLESNVRLLEHVQITKKEVTKLLKSFNLGIAAQVLFNEFWHTFCDICIEEAKPHLYPQRNPETKEIISEPSSEEKSETTRVMLYAMKEYLKMLHPFIPFITECIWREVPKKEGEGDIIMYVRWE